VPETGRQRERQGGDSAASRLADHAGISRLTEELLPALIAKLSTTQLGELEVREGDWHIRLRRPYGVGPGEGRRAADKPSRSQPGHEGHGHGRAAVEGHRPGRTSGAAAGSSGSSGAGTSGGAMGTTAGSGAASAATNGTGGSRAAPPDAGGASDKSRSIATSPAVGTFSPGPKATSGTRVRAGDSLGTVDVLGIPQDIPAPADGIVGQTLVEAGMAVEYGQELIRLELTVPAEARGS
jgi:biotin carboxyl carrier protein